MVPIPPPVLPAVSGSPVDLKIQRADHHRQELLAELQAFREREPYLVREDHKQWNGLRYRVVAAHHLERPPESIALLLGDFVNNLRAALDYLVGEMRIDGPSRDSAFPICKSYAGPTGFRNLSKRKLAGVPEPAKKLIERMQPYERGRPRLERLRWRALGILEALWRVEKHRTILLATSFVTPKYVGHNRTGDQPSGIGHRLSISDRQAEWWLPIDDREQDFDPHFGVEVALAKPRGFADDWPRIGGWELDGLVDYMHKTVFWDVLPHLRRFIYA